MEEGSSWQTMKKNNVVIIAEEFLSQRPENRPLACHEILRIRRNNCTASSISVYRVNGELIKLFHTVIGARKMRQWKHGTRICGKRVRIYNKDDDARV